MEIQAWALSDVGRVREHNEDNYALDPSLGLLIVADGMGGHAAGEVASQTAVSIITKSIQKAKPLFQQYEENAEESTRKQILALIEQVVQDAGAAIYDMGQQDQKRRGMGTTVSVLLLVGNRGFIGHVGDSRIYLYRQSRLHQLTEDHSLIQELIKRGKLKKEDAEKSPYRNAVTRAVGIYAAVEVDTFDFDIFAEDTFLLCSDGLSGYVKDEEMPRFLLEPNGEKIPQTLIDVANERGGKDNITSIIARVFPGEQSVEQVAPDYQLQMETLKQTALFQYFFHNELLRLSGMMKYRRFSKEDALIRENERSSEFFVILSGKVRLERNGQFIAQYKNADTCGEISLVTRAKKSASVIAEGDVEALSLSRKDFFEIVKNEDAIAVKLLWQFVQILAERLKLTTEELVIAQASTIPDS